MRIVESDVESSILRLVYLGLNSGASDYDRVAIRDFSNEAALIMPVVASVYPIK